jgi:HEAT repeat protein
MVLTELAPRDTAVVHALGDALKDANQLLTKYLLEALDAIGTRSVVPYVLPLLESHELETKLRAAAILAKAGGDIVPELARQFAKASPEQRRVLVDILGRIHTREAMGLLLDVVGGPDVDLARETCEAVRRHGGDATPAQRQALHRQIVVFLKSSKVRKDERLLNLGLLLMGCNAAPEALAALLQYTGPRQPVAVRRHALQALKNQAIPETKITLVGRNLLGYMGEPDYLNVVQPTLDVVEKLPLPKSFETAWRKLLGSKHPSVRNFAVRRLAATDTDSVNRLLMTLLDHADPQVSDIAAGALARHRTATPRLLAAFSRERHPEAAWLLAKILKPHGSTLDKKAIKQFRALAVREVTDEQPRAEALLYFLRNIEPALADEVVRDVGLKFRHSGKWARSVACLRQLQRGDSFDASVRYDLAVCLLKLSPKDLAPHLRADDQALRGLQLLLQDKSCKLIDRLKADRALQPADLFYMGFHFSEGTGEESRFGQQLLALIVQRWPRSKEAAAARSKLKAESPAASARSESTP